MVVYCAPADLYSFGLPRGALPNPGRAASFYAANDTCVIGIHGFALNDLVSFRAESGGQLPKPLAPAVEYFAIPLTLDTFQIAETADGPAIDLLTDGNRVLAIAPLKIDAAIAWASRLIDDMLPAHIVPLVPPIHDLVVMTCAELAAKKLLTGSSSKSLTDMTDAAMRRLQRWATGVPLRGANVPRPANVAVSGASVSQNLSGGTIPRADPSGWRTFGGT